MAEIKIEELKTNYTKSIFKSKTFWVNVITIATGVLAAFSQAIPQSWTPWLLALVGAANVFLRFLTKKPVSLPKFKS